MIQYVNKAFIIWKYCIFYIVFPKGTPITYQTAFINFHSIFVMEQKSFCSLLSSTFLDNIHLEYSVKLKKAAVSIFMEFTV